MIDPKFLGEETQSEIDNAIMEGKAIPELRLKFDIIDTWANMRRIRGTLVRKHRLSNMYDVGDIAIFMDMISQLGGLLYEMIYKKSHEYKKKRPEEFGQDQIILSKIQKINFGVNYDVRNLMIFSFFLEKYLDRLYISNLLRYDLDELSSFKKDYF